MKIEVGTIVRHPLRPAWGPGKTLAGGGGDQVTVYFRDIEETKAGDAVTTLATRTVGLEIAAKQSESMLDSLPPFDKGRFRGVRKARLSLEDAVQTCLRKEPGALDDSAVRDAKRASQFGAHEMWVDLRITAELNWWTYRRLLELARILLARSKPLGAVDFFDVLPFMKVIAAA